MYTEFSDPVQYNTLQLQLLFYFIYYSTVIFFLNNSMTTFIFSSKAVGILSWIGGYVGLWLGISFLHVYDFIEKWTFRLVTCIRKKYFKKKILPRKKIYDELYRKRRWWINKKIFWSFISFISTTYRIMILRRQIKRIKPFCIKVSSYICFKIDVSDLLAYLGRNEGENFVCGCNFGEKVFLESQRHYTNINDDF